jgi:hypothetical protein
MQRAEMEELRHREANNTALQAIGPRKKLKLDPDATATTVSKHFSTQLWILHLTITVIHSLVDGNKRNCRHANWNKSSSPAASPYQARQHARHDILHGAREGQLSQFDVVQSLSQVINRWPTPMVHHCCYVFLLTV